MGFKEFDFKAIFFVKKKDCLVDTAFTIFADYMCTSVTKVFYKISSPELKKNCTIKNNTLSYIPERIIV